ncbi:MAG: hypothetical protein QM723_17165 [Myxococcaceae bacterium]
MCRWPLFAVLLLVAGCKTAPPPPPPPQIDFRQELRPYGQWLIEEPYGKVWAPNPEIVGKNFVPYVTNGQWVYDPKKGWVFDSNYKFGDLVFHYGRWVHVQSLDWLWVEDKEWGPAWVQWKTSSEYVGWTTLPPANKPAPVPEWFFVKARHFAQPEIEKFRLAGDDVGKATDQTQPVKTAPGAPAGPAIELIVAERGVEKDAHGVYHAAELPPANPPVVETAPAPEPDPDPPPPPPEKKKKKKSKKTK